jgi:hypothetical protein
VGCDTEKLVGKQLELSSERSTPVDTFPDIFTEPEDLEVNTLANVGPLQPLAGVSEGTRSLDITPKGDGPLQQAFVKRIELQPIDPRGGVTEASPD